MWTTARAYTPGMLDLDHPRTQFIFEASRIEEQMRGLLLAWLSGEALQGQAEILNVLLPRLHDLNRQHFGHAAGISATLNRLAAAVQRFDVRRFNLNCRGADSADAQAAWTCFLDLAERPGDNFGTWAI